MSWLNDPNDLDDMSITITTGAIGATGSDYTYPYPTGTITSGAFNGTNYGDLTFGPTTNGALDVLLVRGRAVFEDEVTIGGKNLGETLEAINRRLNILTTDPELESRWAALADLHERYRELEAECLEAEEMIRILRK